MSLRTRLSKPLYLADGRCLRTIGDAIEIVLEMPMEELARPRWQHIPDVLKAAVHSGREDDAARATSQFEAALSASPLGNLSLADDEKNPPARAVRRQSKRTPAVRGHTKAAGTRRRRASP